MDLRLKLVPLFAQARYKLNEAPAGPLQLFGNLSLHTHKHTRRHTHTDKRHLTEGKAGAGPRGKTCLERQRKGRSIEKGGEGQEVRGGAQGEVRRRRGQRED